MMLNYEIEAKDMSFGPTVEEKRWAARKACMFAAMGGSAEDVSDCHTCEQNQSAHVGSFL